MRGLVSFGESNIEESREDDSERLRYRRQFVLGPRPLAEFPSWQRIKIGDDVFLTAHPDLDTLQVFSNGKSLTLLGFILDPQNPGSDDSAILAQLLPELCSDTGLNESLQSTNRFGGRWILIADNGSRITLLSDALGQRQVYYTFRPIRGEVWCASQPGIVADILNLKPSRDAIEFIAAQKSSGQEEYWFPGNTSLYDDVKLLLPNHYLDLTHLESRRFWPCRSLAEIPLHEVVKNSATLIRGLMMSAANRFPLKILITAGWDSRVVLAAAMDLKTEVSYSTFVKGDSSSTNPDVNVPARLLPKLGKIHEILNIPDRMDPVFGQLYLQNVAAAHECYGPTAQALYGSTGPAEVRVSGGGSETVRQQFRPSVRGSMTAEILAEFAHTTQKFAIEAFEVWLSGVPTNMGFDVLDLFYWEQKCGQWLAAGQVEWDIAGESIAAFDCRTLLATLLSAHEDYRLPPDYELYRTLLKRLSPKVLSEPINPHKKLGASERSFRARVKRALVKYHLREYLPAAVLNLAKKVVR
jgi:hypothetical protein